MPRRVSPSQLQSFLRQAQSQRRQAIQKYNQAVDRYNRELKGAVDKYNRDVRAHNSRVQMNKQRIRSALDKLQQTPVIRAYTTMRTSTYALNEAYVRLEQRVRYSESDPRHRLMLELPQQENANNLAMMNALAGGESDELEVEDDDLQSTSITDELSQISADLNDRWRGALFSLNPRNPDAARHFCASAREIFTQVLHTRASDSAVLSALPACLKTDQGKPTRRARIHFLLHQKKMIDHDFEDFVDKDIDNIIELFNLFNEGAHGEAGRFDLTKLLSLKHRVEGAIIFVTSIAK
jgi:hypothetical protein